MRARNCFCTSLPVFIFRNSRWYFENQLLDGCQTMVNQLIQLIMGTETGEENWPDFV